MGMLLLPGFNSFAAHGFLDPFRAANYLRGERIYHWDMLSLEGGAVAASNGFQVGETVSILEHSPDYDLVLVNASWTPEAFREPTLQAWLRSAARRGVLLGGMDTGAFVLAYAGLLAHHHNVVHYEHLDSFRELFPSIQADETLYSIDDHGFSCCGGEGAVDLALELIRWRDGIELANAASRYIFHPRLREGGEPQVHRALQPVGYQVPARLREAILLMERNIEEPLTQPELAGLLGLSPRQLQRLFKQYVGVTPVRYYLNLRLDRARGLITQTGMPVMEIATLCGFLRPEQFSRAYSKRFEITPIRDRIEGRIPFELRNVTSRAAYHSVD
jgi:AraC family carnitine catabolism transcriptional activator